MLQSESLKSLALYENTDLLMSRINILGCPIDCLSMGETLDKIESIIKGKTPRQHVVINVAKLVDMHRDNKLKEIISACDIINVDGMPIVWASKLLGTPLPERVAGVDLFQELIKLSSQKGYRPFFFGARQWVVGKVVEEFKKKYPNLNVAGYRNGYFKESEERSIAEMINNSHADILFVGFSSPIKEKFLNRWMSTMEVPFCMGVGGSFDIVAGRTKRAPLWVQNYGLEWLYRLLQEPRRMWKRYATTNPVFIWMVIKEFFKRKRHDSSLS